ncbi:SAM-dependent methyltransferase [Candidatus Micrarchaeota archaeon]|nr:SAM-dependent methyltransferase [Candidatus Micrarchaeota archaeon]
MSEEFVSFFQLQKQANEEYYSRKGINLYEDFGTTVSKSSKVSVAQALEFYARLAKLEREGRLPSEINVHEYGIGNGAFAAFFLETMKKLDEKNSTRYYEKIMYVLGDISKKLLEDVRKRKEVNAHAKVIEFIELDATNPPFNKKNVLYMRSSEVWDDLPTILLVKKKNEVLEALTLMKNEQEVEMKIQMQKTDAWKQHGFEKEITEMMKAMPEEYAIPVSVGAAQSLEKCSQIMDFERGAVLDVIDYGFTNAEEITGEPEEMWNEFVVRVYGTQLTVDVNFLFLEKVAENLRLQAKTLQTTEYLENVLSEKIFPVTLGTGKKAYVGYLTGKEMAERKSELKKSGYSKEFIKGKIREDDGYRAMRIMKRKSK